MFKTGYIRSHERGLLFRKGEFQRILPAGTYALFYLLGKLRIDVVSLRDPWLTHPELDLLIKSGVLTGMATVVDLKDNERGLVWIDGRFTRILLPGQYAYWHGFRDVKVEIVNSSEVRFEHPELQVIVTTAGTGVALETCVVAEGFAGLQIVNGKYVATLSPGRYAFWRNVSTIKVQQMDLRELTLDVAGQEIMTSDKVTLRMNAVVSFHITDPLRAHTVAEDVKQTLYREAQLALRAVVGTRDLDSLLSAKDSVARELDELLRQRAGEFGLTLISTGIRDIILPGEMRELLNKVTEAKKAAEANLITRREETAAVRNQANTARLLETNPTLMRLRELETLEKVADKAKLQVVIGEKGLVEKIVNLI